MRPFKHIHWLVLSLFAFAKHNTYQATRQTSKQVEKSKNYSNKLQPNALVSFLEKLILSNWGVSSKEDVQSITEELIEKIIETFFVHKQFASWEWEERCEILKKTAEILKKTEKKQLLPIKKICTAIQSTLDKSDKIIKKYLSSFKNDPGVVIQLLAAQNKSGPLKLFLNAGYVTYIDAANKAGKTALYYSLIKEAFESYKVLIDHGANTHVYITCEKMSCHLLMTRDTKKYAAYFNYYTGKQPKNYLFGCSDKTDRRTLLLFRYIANNNFEGVLDLLSTSPKLDINAKNENGLTPLIAAVSHGDRSLKITKSLLEQENIDVNSTDDAGNSALLLACTNPEKMSETRACLLGRKEIDPNIPNFNGYTPLIICSKMGDKFLDPMGQLLAHPKTDVNFRDHGGNTALLWAVFYTDTQKKSKAVACLLGHKKIDPNIPNFNGENPLIICSKRGDKSLGIVDQLLAHPKIDVNKADSEKATPLILCAKQVNKAYQIMERLIAFPGIDPNKKDIHGYTALHIIFGASASI